MDCCQFIEYDKVYCFTPLDQTDGLDGRSHVFDDVKLLWLNNWISDECIDAFCAELESGLELSTNFKSVFDNNLWQMGVANLIYYQYLCSYGELKFESESQSSLDNKKQAALQIAKTALDKFIKLHSNLFADCTIAPTTNCQDVCCDEAETNFDFSYDII